MMVSCKCEKCGKTFFVKYPSLKRKFCSHKCANNAAWDGKTRVGKVQFSCKTCGKVFYVLRCDHRFKEGSEIKYCSNKCAGAAIRTGEQKPCKQCGKLFYSTRHDFCSRECASEYRAEHSAHKPYMENGYVVHHVRGYNKKGNAKEHRLVVEEAIGRRLGKDEVVHHVNGIKTDNRLENLRVMGRKEHSELHRRMEKGEV